MFNNSPWEFDLLLFLIVLIPFPQTLEKKFLVVINLTAHVTRVKYHIKAFWFLRLAWELKNLKVSTDDERIGAQFLCYFDKPLVCFENRTL